MPQRSRRDATGVSRKRLQPPRRRAGDDFDLAAFLERVAAGKTVREYRLKQRVFSQGDVADAVFYIQKGKVQVTVVSTRGKEAVIAVLKEGSFLGEGCLAGQPLRISTASVLQPATIVRVEKQTMVSQLHRDPAFADLLLAGFVAARAESGEMKSRVESQELSWPHGTSAGIKRP